MCASRERGSDIARLAELVASGSVTPAIDRTFPLSRAPEAMRELEAGRVRGKVAIRVRDLAGTSEVTA
jgi:NADPH:quinone reductase-like Zn-dependent oxidoreductase